MVENLWFTRGIVILKHSVNNPCFVEPTLNDLNKEAPAITARAAAIDTCQVWLSLWRHKTKQDVNIHYGMHHIMQTLNRFLSKPHAVMMYVFIFMLLNALRSSTVIYLMALPQCKFSYIPLAIPDNPDQAKRMYHFRWATPLFLSHNSVSTFITAINPKKMYSSFLNGFD